MTADVDMANNPFDWPTLLPPRQGSCLNLSNVEPCVNKAIYHLDALKKSAKEKEKGRSLAKSSFSEIHTEREKDVRSDSKAVTSRSASGRVNKLSNVAIQSPTAHGLYVEGTTTGTEKDRKNIHPPQLQQGGGGQLDLDVIAGAINLVGRLEHDRQGSLAALSNEKVKVQQLGLALDAEVERRLDLLGTEVQRGGVKSNPAIPYHSLASHTLCREEWSGYTVAIKVLPRQKFAVTNEIRALRRSHLLPWSSSYVATCLVDVSILLLTHYV